MKLKEFLEIYTKLKEEYGLLDFEEINTQINLKKSIKKYRKISKKSILKLIINKYYEKYKQFIQILEGVLNPDLGTLAAIHEAKEIKFDYDKLWSVYKKIVRILRLKKALDIEFDEKLAKELIQTMYNYFEESKNIVKDIFIKKAEFWTKDIKYRGIKEYIG